MVGAADPASNFGFQSSSGWHHLVIAGWWFQWIGLRKIYRKAPYLIGKSMASCKFSLKPIQSWLVFNPQNPSSCRPHGAPSFAKVGGSGRVLQVGLVVSIYQPIECMPIFIIITISSHHHHHHHQPSLIMNHYLQYQVPICHEIWTNINQSSAFLHVCGRVGGTKARRDINPAGNIVPWRSWARWCGSGEFSVVKWVG